VMGGITIMKPVLAIARAMVVQNIPR